MSTSHRGSMTQRGKKSSKAMRAECSAGSTPRSRHRIYHLAKLPKQIDFKRKGGRHLIGISGREIETRGLAHGFWTDLYHRSMTVTWPSFFGTAAVIFIVLNAVFGFLYWLGHEPIANVAREGPPRLFFFFVETLAPLGS